MDCRQVRVVKYENVVGLDPTVVFEPVYDALNSKACARCMIAIVVPAESTSPFGRYSAAI